MSKKYLKVLCLHGYRQNANSFKEKLGAFRKAVKKHVEFVFISAPLEVPPLELDEQATYLDGRGWWFSREDNYFNAHDVSDVSIGFDKSLAVIEESFKNDGPFDGLLGFSQGAAMVAILCSSLHLNKLTYKFSFAILVAGFKSHSTLHQHFYSLPDLVTIPTLHVYGETDKVIPKEMSEDLEKMFQNPVILCHAGGHFVNASSQYKKIYNDFFDKCI